MFTSSLSIAYRMLTLLGVRRVESWLTDGRAAHLMVYRAMIDANRPHLHPHLAWYGCQQSFLTMMLPLIRRGRWLIPVQQLSISHHHACRRRSQLPWEWEWRN